MDGENAPFASPVMDNVSGQFHQHIYAMRLDTMFDGLRNTVYTVDAAPLKGDLGSADNPYGQGFSTTVTPLRSTKEGFSDTSTEKSRFWIIGNPNELHQTTRSPTSWKLYPGNPVRLMAKPGSHVYRQAGFARHAVWVTPYNEDQIYPGSHSSSIIPSSGMLESLNDCTWIELEFN